MTAVASAAGVISATAPGGIVTPPPFTDHFTRADGDAGQPWFNPRCDVPILQIVSDTLQASNENYPRCRAGLLLDSGDIDVTFTASFSAHRTGVRDDIQLWFRCTPCAPPDSGVATDAIGVTMQPNLDTGLTGSSGVSVYRQSGTTLTQTAIRAIGTVNEGDTHTFRVMAQGTALDVFMDDLVHPFLVTTIDLLPGQTTAYLVLGKLLSYVDDVSFVAPSTPPPFSYFDDFNRADASVLGGSWSVFGSGTFGIASNRAKFAGGTGGEFVAYWDVGVSDGTMQATVATASASGGYLAFRSTGQWNSWFVSDSGLFKTNGIGNYTTVATFTGPSSGDVVQVVLSGSSIVVKINGTTVASVTDSYNSTATKHGMRGNGSSDPGWRIDDWTFTP